MPDASPMGPIGGDRESAEGRTVPAGTPRWVKAFGIVALILVVLFATLHLTGHSLGGHHHHRETPAHGGPS